MIKIYENQIYLRQHFISEEKLEFYNMIIVIGSGFHKGNKFYSQDFLHECKLSALHAECYIFVRVLKG